MQPRGCGKVTALEATIALNCGLKARLLHRSISTTPLVNRASALPCLRLARHDKRNPTPMPARMKERPSAKADTGPAPIERRADRPRLARVIRPGRVEPDDCHVPL